MKKKWLALLASIAMVVSILPAMVFAEGADVASVDGTNYQSLQAAVDAADGKTVTLLADVTENVTIAAGKTITLDLGTFKITNTGANNTITNNGTLTIQGSGTVDNVSNKKAPIFNTTTGTMIITSGTFSRSAEASVSATANGGNSWYVVFNQGTMTINGGTFKFSDTNNGPYSSLIVNGWPSPSGNTGKVFAQLTINGGTFTGGKMTVKNDDYGKLEIKNGSFTQTENSNYCVFSWNEATIEDGTFTGHIGAQGDGSTSENAYENGSITIKGGTVDGRIEANNNSDIKLEGGSFTGKVDTYADSASISVTGGSYKELPADFIDDTSAVVGYKKAETTDYYVGTEQEITELVNKAIKGDEIEVLNGNLDLSIPVGGVKITNSGEGTVKVNDETVGDDTLVTPEEPSNTSDSNSMIWLALMLIAACGFGTALIMKKKTVK